jgi:hypothetical protein
VTTTLADEPAFTTTVLQMGVVQYPTDQLGDSESYVDRYLDLDDVAVVELTTDDVARAPTLLAGHGETGIGGREATVVAAMERRGVERLWTHDGGLKRLDETLDWLTVIGPVE